MNGGKYSTIPERLVVGLPGTTFDLYVFLVNAKGVTILMNTIQSTGGHIKLSYNNPLYHASAGIKRLCITTTAGSSKNGSPATSVAAEVPFWPGPSNRVANARFSQVGLPGKVRLLFSLPSSNCQSISSFSFWLTSSLDQISRSTFKDPPFQFQGPEQYL